MSTVFTMQEVENTVGKEAMKYGFLYKSHPVSRMQDSQVSFIHKTVQEWLAAFYIAHNEHELQHLRYSSIEEVDQDASFHGFLLSFCKDNQKHSHILCEKVLPYFTTLLETAPRKEAIQWLKANSKYFIQVLYKSYGGEKKWSPLPDPPLPYHSCLGFLLRFQKDVAQLQLHKIINSKDELIAFVDAVGDVQLPTIQLHLGHLFDHDDNRQQRSIAGGGQAVNELLLKMPECTKLKISDRDMNDSDLQAIVPAVKTITHMKKLNLSFNKFAGGGQVAGELLMCLSSKSRHETYPMATFKMRDCQLTLTDLQAMVAVTKGMPLHIRKFDLSLNNFAGGGQATGELLLCVSSSSSREQHGYNVESFNLKRCELTARDLQAITSTICGKQVCIELLDVAYNNFVKGGEFVGELILCLSFGKDQEESAACKLILWRCGLTVRDLQALVDAVDGKQLKLTQLDLSWNNIKGGGEAAGKLMLCLFSNINHEKHIYYVETLKLCGCELTVSDLQAIVAIIRGKQLKIKHLDVSENDFSGGGKHVGDLLLCLSPACSFEELGCFMDTLTMLRCCLTMSDLQAVVAVISGKHITIKQLDFSHNNFVGGGQAAGELLMCLSSSSGQQQHEDRVEILHLSDCELVVSDLQAMMETTEGRQVDIKQLDLSGNDFARIGPTLGELLLKFSRCELLNLQQCQMISSDLRAAGTAIACNSVNIGKLCVWENDIPEENETELMERLPFVTFERN